MIPTPYLLAPIPPVVSTFNAGPHLKGTPRGPRFVGRSKYDDRNVSLNAAQKAADTDSRQRGRRELFQAEFALVTKQYAVSRAERRRIARARVKLTRRMEAAA